MRHPAMHADPDERELIGLIHEIHRASVEPERWLHFLHALRAALMAQDIQFAANYDSRPGVRAVLTLNVDPQMEARYMEHFAAIDPNTKAFRLALAGEVGRPEERLLPLRE